MLIVALVLAVVSLAALVTAVVTSNEMIAWVCIGFSALGVLLLIVDAVRDRHREAAPATLAPDRTEVIAPVVATEVIKPVETTAVIESGAAVVDADRDEFAADDESGVVEYAEYAGDADEPDVDGDLADYPDFDDLEVAEDHPDEVISDEPDDDLPSDDEPVYPVPAEEAALHIVAADDLIADPGTTTSESHSESFTQPYTDASTTVIYAGEPYTDETSTVTESYVVISADESDTVVVDESDTVVVDESDTVVVDESDTVVVDESDTVVVDDAAADTSADGSSTTVIYAEEIDDAESGGSAERHEPGSER
jgi:hypothetical protein